MTQRPTNIQLNRPVARGQGGLIAVALILLIGSVMVAMSLANRTNQTATGAVAVKQSLQAYYVADAGIQEALANRLMPRSNYQSFVNTSGNDPYLKAGSSGQAYQDPDTRQNRLGQYRYVVLGGDSARDKNGNYYANTSMANSEMPRLYAYNTIPSDTPFMIVSKGTICRTAGSRVSVAELNKMTQYSVDARCANGTVADSITLLAVVRINNENGSPNGQVVNLMSFKDDSQVRLPYGSAVPGYGWKNANDTVDFNTMWKQGGVTLKHIEFYDFATNQPYKGQDITGAFTTIPGTVPSSATIRLYFDTPIDYRSISITNDRNLTDCQTNPATKCRMQVMQPDLPLNPVKADGTGGKAYTGNVIIPLVPVATQVTLLPPLTNTIDATNRFAIKIDGKSMRTFNNLPGEDYTIVFNTQ